MLPGEISDCPVWAGFYFPERSLSDQQLTCVEYKKGSVDYCQAAYLDYGHILNV